MRRLPGGYGETGKHIIVFDPFSGSGTTGMAALNLGCSYIGFEIDKEHVDESNRRLKNVKKNSRNHQPENNLFRAEITASEKASFTCLKSIT